MSPTDFLLLYQQLGLRPDSSIDELKLAYRRRVAALHPDRQGAANSANVELARERLQQLTVLYGSVTAFHRRHGRLPGASMTPQSTLAAAKVAPASTRRMRTGFFAAALAALAVLATAARLWPDSAEDGGFSGADDDAMAAQVTPDQSTGASPDLTLELGMLKDDVLSIEKEPISRGDDRWDYGPSWIAFERGKVSGWYSSPLRPLQRATEHPRPQAIEHAAR